jgi:type II secretory pathway component PulF
MNQAAVSVFCKDLSNMLSSGIGLDHALRTLGETLLEPSMRQMCAQALIGLEQGESLGTALRRGGVLPREAVTAVHAGEKAGELPVVFMMLSDYFELRSDMRRKFLSAFGYPLLVIGILTGVLVYVSVNVVPKIAGLLPAGAMSSPVTAALMAVSSFLSEYWVTTGVGVIVLAGTGVSWARVYPDTVVSFLCRVPLIGPVIREQELALAFFALYVFQKSGVRLDAALQESALVAGGMTRIHLEKCSVGLESGLSFSEAVRQDKFFPRFTADTLRIGEESGRFEEYSERLYRTFYRSFQARMEYLSGALRPLLLMISAGFIVLIAVGFLQPLYANLTNVGTL